jgi:hypothetical protein
MSVIITIITCDRPRGASYLHQTATGLLREGALDCDERVILGDGSEPAPEAGWETRAVFPKGGVRGNMWAAFRLAIAAGHERLIFCEDDIVPCKNAVHRILQLDIPPDVSFVDFHDMKELRESGLPPGLHNLLSNGLDSRGYWGTQCMLFPRRTLEWLVQWDPMSIARWDPPQGADRTLGWMLQWSPWPLYAAHLPRLVRHVGSVSAAHPGWDLQDERATFEYPSDSFNALSVSGCSTAPSTETCAASGRQGGEVCPRR